MKKAIGSLSVMKNQLENAMEKIILTKPKTSLYFILLTNKLQEVIFTFKSLPTLMKNIYVNGEEISISEKNPKFIDFSINISTEFLGNLTV